MIAIRCKLALLIVLHQFLVYGEDPDLSSLNRYERAFAEAFLIENPRYRMDIDPFLFAGELRGTENYNTLTTEQQEWRKNITEDSYHKFKEIFPDFEERIERGRRNRELYFREIVEAWESTAKKRGHYDPISASVKNSYFEALKDYHQMRQRRLSEAEAREMAATRVIKKFGIDPRISDPLNYLNSENTDEDSRKKDPAKESPKKDPAKESRKKDPNEVWRKPANKYFEFLVQMYMGEKIQERKKENRFLPEPLFEKWRLYELARLRALRKKLTVELRIFRAVAEGKTVESPSELAPVAFGNYVNAYYAENYLLERYRIIDHILPDLTKTEFRDQSQFLEIMGELSTAELEWRENTYVERMIGSKLQGSNMRDGELNRTKTGYEWVSAVGWSEGLNGMYWYDRRMDNWQLPSVKTILNPEGEAEQREKENQKLWESRRDFMIKMGVGAATGALLIYGANKAMNELDWSQGESPDLQKGDAEGEPKNFIVERRDHESRNKPVFLKMGERKRSEATFLLNPLESRLETLPTDFILPVMEDFREGTVRRIKVGGMKQPSFEIELRRPIEAMGGYLPLLFAQGYSVDVELYRGDKLLVFQKDYIVEQTEHGAMAIRVFDSTGEFRYKIRYQRENRMVPPSVVLTEREKLRLREVSLKLREAGLLSLHEGIEGLLRSEKSITAQNIANTFQEYSLYSEEPATKVSPKWGNKFSAYREFVNRSGTVCMQCDTANEILYDVLTEILVDHPTLEIKTEYLLQRDPLATKIFTDIGHLRVSAKQRGHPTAAKWDATPYEIDPRTSQKIPGEPTNVSEAKRMREDPLFYYAFLRLVLEAQENSRRKKLENVEKKEEVIQREKPLEKKTMGERIEARLEEAGVELNPEDMQAERERLERERRNQKRESTLSILNGHRNNLLQNLEGTISMSGKALPVERALPHFKAIQLSRVVETYVAAGGLMSESELIQKIAKIANVPREYSIQETLDSAVAKVRESIETMRTRHSDRRSGIPEIYKLYLEREIVLPTNQLLDFLSKSSWTPLEIDPNRLEDLKIEMLLEGRGSCLMYISEVAGK